MVKYPEAEVGDTFAALADPTRRAILEHLTAGPAPASALIEPTGVSLPAVMKHLHILESCGLTESRKVGRVRTCSIRPDGLDAAAAWITLRQKTWRRRLHRLDTYLQNHDLDDQESG